MCVCVCVYVRVHVCVYVCVYINMVVLFGNSWSSVFALPDPISFEVKYT